MFFKQSDSGSVFVLPFANLTICCSMDEKIVYVLEILCSCHHSWILLRGKMNSSAASI